PWLLPSGSRARATGGAVTVVDLPERRLVCVRHVGGIGALGAPVARLVALAEERGWLDPSAWLVLVFHDDSMVVEEDAWRIDLGWELPAGEPAPPGFDLHVLPAGPHATLTAAGAADEINEAATRFLYEDIPASGLQPASFESVLEVPAGYAWEALSDLPGLLARPMVARALHHVGPPGALLRG
ncbi:MAG TPA: GyrI-like domain-containing protein, partial [Myxococcota bacterium]|nr:GyrI-like domain-containing protein [Myxococcota bacterium]